MPLLFMPSAQANEALCYLGFLMLIYVYLLASFVCLSVSIKLLVSSVSGYEATGSNRALQI